MRLGQSLLISTGEPRRSTVDWQVIFAPEGNRYEGEFDLLRTLGNFDMRNINALWPDFDPERNIIQSHYFPVYKIQLTRSLPGNGGKSSFLDLVCQISVSFNQLDEPGSDHLTATLVDARVFSDNFGSWLQSVGSEPDLVTSALNHCFLMSMGLPNTSSADQLMPILEATRATLKCARRENVVGDKGTADSLRTLEARLRASCGDASATQ